MSPRVRGPARVAAAAMLTALALAAPARAEWVSRTVDGTMGTRIVV